MGLFTSNLTKDMKENMENQIIVREDFELVEEQLTWLKNYNSPWRTVTKNWALTTYRRMYLYNSNKCTITEYFNTYPKSNLWDVDFTK